MEKYVNEKVLDKMNEHYFVISLLGFVHILWKRASFAWSIVVIIGKIPIIRYNGVVEALGLNLKIFRSRYFSWSINVCFDISSKTRAFNPDVAVSIFSIFLLVAVRLFIIRSVFLLVFSILCFTFESLVIAYLSFFILRLQKPYKFLELKKRRLSLVQNYIWNRENLKIVTNEYANYDWLEVWLSEHFIGICLLN